MGEKLSFPPFLLLNLIPPPLRRRSSDKCELITIRSSIVFVWIWIVWWMCTLVPTCLHCLYHVCCLYLVVLWFHGFMCVFPLGFLCLCCLVVPKYYGFLICLFLLLFMLGWREIPPFRLFSDLLLPARVFLSIWTHVLQVPYLPTDFTHEGYVLIV